MQQRDGKDAWIASTRVKDCSGDGWFLIGQEEKIETRPDGFQN
jgi:hypothetical protein